MSRDDIIKLAESLGWRRFDRNGVEVWYDPEGGHVSWDELPEYIDLAIDALMAECEGKPLQIDDAVALMKRGNPFVDHSQN